MLASRPALEPSDVAVTETRIPEPSEVTEDSKSGDFAPLDLSVGRQEGGRSRSQVILSVPQYKTTAVATGHPDSSTSDTLTVTPVMKKEVGEGEHEEDQEMEQERQDVKRSSFALDSLLSNPQTQSFFSLEQFKQASLIFQKHASLNGNGGLKGSSEFLQHSIWNNLVSSTVSASEAGGEEKRKIHKCDFPTCDKIYTKSSHLKAHKR